MPKYRPLPYNSEVMGVLSCLILGYDNVKSMMKILHQPQSTISHKLLFLKRTGVVKKHRWKFDINWDKLYKTVLFVIKKQFDTGVISSKKPDKITKEKTKSRKQLLALDLESALPKQLIKNILYNYSSLQINFGYPKFSIFEIFEKFLDQLSLSDEKTIREIDEFYNSRLLRIKKLLKYRVTENEFFFNTLVSPKL